MMFDSIWSFIKRNRRKFLFAGVLFGGFVLIGKYAKKKLIEYQEKEAAECLAQFRRQHHFDSNQRNCNTTVLSLLPRLRETLCHQLNSEALTAKLRDRPTNKLEIWEELKIISFTRTVVAVYSSTMLAVFLRVQLNILGGYMYRDSLNSHSPSSSVIATAAVQKQYLASIQYLFEQGLTELIRDVQSAVEEVLGSISLKDSMSSVAVGDVMSDIRQHVERCQKSNGCKESTLQNTLCRFILPASEQGSAEACSLSQNEIVSSRLVNETYDVIHSRDFQIVLTHCLDTGFRWLTCRISEYFKPVLSATNGVVCTDSALSMPLAKVIPVVNGLVNTVLADPPNSFIQELLLKEEVKDFAVNVYDAFCMPHSGDGCGID